MTRLKLPVVLVAVTTKDYAPTIVALRKTLEQIEPVQTIYFSDVPFADAEITHVPIDRFKSVEDYNHFVFKSLIKYLVAGHQMQSFTHILLVQHDGYVLDASAWTDEFLEFDYIGAPWTYTDGRNVGNGGFSLRSISLHRALLDPEFEYTSPEDEKICRYYRQTLEKKYWIRFAPESLAHRFSFEMHRPRQRTFGFHNYFHKPYREPVVLQRRNSSMGDTIMAEPLMEVLHNQGYRVILDVPPPQFNLFANHFFPIEHIANVNPSELEGARIINLEMAYEIRPKQSVLQSYYWAAGIESGVMRNSRLHFKVNKERPEVKLFDKYVILHTDDTDMAHRNVRGVNWNTLADYIESVLGYYVFRVGRGNGTGGRKINTYSENMLAYIVGNADYFVGIDSGVAHIAVACDVPAMIFFGSVNPAYRYCDLSRIKVMQKACPIQKDHCYHAYDEVVSMTGQECQVDKSSPPCIQWDTVSVMNEIKNLIV